MRGRCPPTRHAFFAAGRTGDLRAASISSTLAIATTSSPPGRSARGVDIVDAGDRVAIACATAMSIQAQIAATAMETAEQSASVEHARRVNFFREIA